MSTFHGHLLRSTEQLCLSFPLTAACFDRIPIAIYIYISPLAVQVYLNYHRLPVSGVKKDIANRILKHANKD